MNDFDILALAHVLIAAVALFRVRPALFSLVGGQLIMLRALSNAHDYGRPVSHAYLPPLFFSPPYLEVARNIFVILTIILGITAAISPGPRVKPLERIPRLPRWMLVVLAINYILILISKRTIFQASSVDEDAIVFGFNLGGLRALITSFVLYEIYACVTQGVLTPGRGFALAALSFLLTDYLKGSTGYATSCLIFLALLIFSRRSEDEPVGLRRWLPIIAAVASFVLLAAAIRTVRASLHAEGTSAAIDHFVNRVESTEGSKQSQGEGVETLANGGQAAMHVLECVWLYDSGHSREWRSIYNPFIYTFQPSFLLGPLGIQRDKEAAIEIADYFVTGGGIAIPGEMYWNGGYLCVVIVGVMLAAAIYWSDTRMRSSVPWLLIACNFSPGLTMGSHYGLSQVIRGFVNGVLVVAAYLIYQSFFKPRRSTDHEPGEGSEPNGVAAPSMAEGATRSSDWHA